MDDSTAIIFLLFCACIGLSAAVIAFAVRCNRLERSIHSLNLHVKAVGQYPCCDFEDHVDVFALLHVFDFDEYKDLVDFLKDSRGYKNKDLIDCLDET